MIAQFGLVAGSAYAEKEYIWPNPQTDLLESMLYEQQGFGSANSPATFIVPCDKVTFGTGRNGAAEWLRTAYHDMATADVDAGTGGIDASIGFEVNRDENVGIGFNETLTNLIAFLTPRSSMADLIALGALFAANGCSDGSVEIPFRAGRVDATGPGPSGVPRPEQPLDEHVSSFKKQGFTPQEMIGLVACGHTLGGVHGVDFPEIVDVVNDPVSCSIGHCDLAMRRRVATMKGVDMLYLGANWCVKATDDNTHTFDTTNTGFTAFDNTV